MAKKDSGKMHHIYYEALKALGQKVTERQRTSTYEKMWKSIRKDYQARGETPPNLYKTAKQYRELDYEKTPRDENMNTEPLNEDLDEASARAYLEEYNQRIDDIYNDTYSWIKHGTRKGVQHDEGHLPSIADYRKSELDDEYWTLKAQLQSMMQTIPSVVLAQAIKDNAELDYTTAITELGPSDIQVEFERTLEQLIAISTQIELRAQELMEQAEREYYGQ